ncbi:MAG: DNA-binding response regulator [Spirochaetaceae bacterium]|nr:MAG: DNA-binding response regulator [Spirochaetaceae bacterium]
MARIFVVEDNEGLREAVVSYLELEDHHAVTFDKLAGVEQAASMQRPDLMILDVMLPDGDGFRFARTFRRTFDTPIIFLTARTAESDRITGLELGADDYVVKPFSMKELMLRVKAVLNRTSSGKSGGTAAGRERDAAAGEIRRHLRTGAAGEERTLVMTEATHRVEVDGRGLDCTAAEWRVLQLLAENPGLVLSRERILGSALDYISDASARTVDTHIKNIRAKLGDAAWIETVRGFGYRFAGGTGEAGR